MGMEVPRNLGPLKINIRGKEMKKLIACLIAFLTIVSAASSELADLENFYDIYGETMINYLGSEPTEMYRFDTERMFEDEQPFTMNVATGIPYDELYSASAALINEVGENYFRIGFIEEDGSIIFDIADIPWMKLKIFVFVVKVEKR
jgi:hypothetical protein